MRSGQLTWKARGPVMASGIVNITQATQEDFLSRRGEDVL